MTSRASSGSGRADILHAATQEFADRGYDGATTAQIARRAGVTQPLVLHHFGSKDGLWLAVERMLFDDLAAMIADATRAVEGKPRPERLAHLLRAFARFCGVRPELARMHRGQSRSGEPVGTGALQGPPIDFLRTELVAAIDDGTIAPVDPALVYFALVGASTQVFAEAEKARRQFGLDVGDPALIERQADLMVTMLLHGLLR